MQRLNIAKRELRSFMSDVLALRGAQPHQVSACAKVREALALIQEAELHMASSLAGSLQYPIAKKLKQFAD
jgi:hypothetical protein